MRLNKPALRIMSTAAFLAIISSCAMSAFAGTYYLEDGDEKDVTISNKDSSTSTKNTITIDNKDTADKSTAVRDIWAEEGDDSDGAKDKHKSDDTSAKVTLKDVNIKAGDGEAAISVKDNGGDVTIVLDETIKQDGSVGTNKVTGGAGHAGIEKNSDDSEGGTLVIREKIQGNGNLDVTGGNGTDTVGGSAGIGSAAGEDTNDILVVNAGITAKGGDAKENSGKDGGAGIGTGANSANGTVTIEKGNITAEGGKNGAGIGGGLNGTGNGSVSITGGTVKATGGDNAYAIGSSKSNGGTHDVTINTSTDRTEVTAIARTNSQKAGDVIEGAATGTGTSVSYENLLETNSGVIYFKTLTGADLTHFQTIHNKKFTKEFFNLTDEEDTELHPMKEIERVEPTYDADGYIKYVCTVENCLEIHTVTLEKLQRPDSGKDDDRPTTPTNPSNPTRPGNYDTPASDPTVDTLPQQPGTLPTDDTVPQQPGTLPDGGTTADTTGTADAATDISSASTTSTATADTTAADTTAQEGGTAVAQTGAAAYTASVPGALPQTGQNWLGALAAAFGGFGLLGFGLLSDKKRHFRSR